jgi:hypothetical protein
MRTTRTSERSLLALACFFIEKHFDYPTSEGGEIMICMFLCMFVQICSRKYSTHLDEIFTAG